jgi:hypothetical protein
MNMKINNFIASAVAATLALTSCESRQEQYEQDILNSCNVNIMSQNNLTITAKSSCTGLDTTFTTNFGIATAINVGVLPGIDDVRYDYYDFYALVDGKKVSGFEDLKESIGEKYQTVIEGNIDAQLSNHSELAVYLLHENMYNAQFFVENGDGQLFELKLNEIY